MFAEDLIKILRENSNVNNIKFEFDIILKDHEISFKSLSKYYTRIEFVNCTFEKSFQISNLSLDEGIGINFQNCVFDDLLAINNQNAINISFYDCTFNYTSNIIENSKINNLIIKNSNIHKYFKLNNIESRIIQIHDNQIELIEIWNIKTFRFDVRNISSKIINELNFNSNPEIEHLDVNTSGKINHISIDDLQKARLVGDYLNVFIYSKNFNSITIGNRSALTTVISKITELHFSNSNYEGQLLFQNTDFENLKLNSISCFNGIFSLVNISIANAKFSDLYVKAFYWHQVSFLQTLEIKRCDFSGLKPNNVQWLKNRVLTPDYILEKTKLNAEEIKYQRDAFRQIKSAYLANNDKIEALAFYRNEMRLYWKEIRLIGGDKWYNTLLILLNRFVSDFGQNYLLPLVWMFSIHFLLFMSIFEWEFAFCLDSFIYGLGEYFKLLSPVRLTPKYINTGMGVFTDFWIRVLNGFFIYHFIKATRKFS